MQRNSRPGKGTPKNSDPRPKRSSAPGSGGPSSTGRSSSRNAGKEEAPHRSYTNSSDAERPIRRSFDKSGDGERPARRSFDKSGDSGRPARRSFDRSGDDERPARRSFDKSGDRERPARRSFDRSGDDERPARKPYERSSDRRNSYDRKPAKKDYPGSKPGPPSPDGSMRLNKFLSNSGICSRREADELILAGAVKVNGVIVAELGTKILPTDKVQYGDENVRREKLVYVLLNKPKGYITTTDDPYDRNTVMSLLADAGRERIYPVGRLDRNTSGLLLFTNDGELATKLMHPSHKVRKVYHVELDKALTKADMLTIGEGAELEDGIAMVDEIAYAEGGKSKKEIGVELHSGRNRIVRRIFEALGYEVVKLDRMVFAGLTKKDLPRGRWRFLTEKEVNFLKMIK